MASGCGGASISEIAVVAAGCVSKPDDLTKNDRNEKIIQKKLTESPTGIYWREGEFTLLPVVWEIRDGQKGPSYGKSWNTTELYFEVLP